MSLYNNYVAWLAIKRYYRHLILISMDLLTIIGVDLKFETPFICFVSSLTVLYFGFA